MNALFQSPGRLSVVLDISLSSERSNTPVISLLINLLLLNETGELAKKVLNEASIGDVLRTRVDLDINTDTPFKQGFSKYSFEGSIVELFARMDQRFESFKLFLDLDVGSFDASAALIFYICYHNHTIDWKEYCFVSRLLQIGATPNVLGYTFTPLQIAVACWDFEGVKLLLEARADPNGTGDGEGVEWKKDSMYEPLNSLHGKGPLHIRRFFECAYVSPIKRKRRRKPLGNIEAIPVEYGADEFNTIETGDTMERRNIIQSSDETRAEAGE